MEPNVHWWFKFDPVLGWATRNPVNLCRFGSLVHLCMRSRFFFCPPIYRELLRTCWKCQANDTKMLGTTNRCQYDYITIYWVPPNHPKVDHFSIETITNLQGDPSWTFTGQAVSAKRSRKSTKRGFEWAGGRYHPDGKQRDGFTMGWELWNHMEPFHRLQHKYRTVRLELFSKTGRYPGLTMIGT